MLNKDLVCRGVKDQEYIRNSTELKVKKNTPKPRNFQFQHSCVGIKYSVGSLPCCYLNSDLQTLFWVKLGLLQLAPKATSKEQKGRRRRRKWGEGGPCHTNYKLLQEGEKGNSSRATPFSALLYIRILPKNWSGTKTFHYFKIVLKTSGLYYAWISSLLVYAHIKLWHPKQNRL